MSDDMARDLSNLAECLYGTDSSAFDNIDAILMVVILSYVNRMGTLHTAGIVAIKAIVDSSTINPELARQYAGELAAS